MKYDLLCIGNALLDQEFRVDDAFLDQYSLTKGTMHLIEIERIRELKSALTDHQALKQQCGGSAANTAYATCGFRQRVYFTGKVADDEAGNQFNDEFNLVGIETNRPSMPNGSEATGQCILLITEDGERTMNTCLSISEALSTDDLDESAISNSKQIFIEGYLASSDTGHLAASRARELSTGRNQEVNVTISDVSMVNGFRGNLEKIMGNGIHRVFCNVDEALAWCGTDRLDIAVTILRDVARIPIVTLGPQGCVIGVTKTGKRFNGEPANTLDVNGAGDMFAGAYLASILAGADETDAAKFANYAAAKQVEHFGPRLDSIQSYGRIKDRFQSSVKGIA
ncbi:MAG: adenosine kinase [Gammaproteobacteria bacterium]|nr:adenosine kinase [Gammaproteobacteria bacterium]